MISTTLGMTKMLYQLTISSLRLRTAMVISVMKNLDPPFPQVALLHPLIPLIVTPSLVFFMTQLKPLETAWLRPDSKTKQTATELVRQIHHCHRNPYRCCHQCPLPHPNLQCRANLLVSALVTKELTRMESFHLLSYRYTTRRTWNIHYRQSMYQTRNREVVAQWQEGVVDIVRNSWYCNCSEMSYCNRFLYSP